MEPVLLAAAPTAERALELVLMVCILVLAAMWGRIGPWLERVVFLPWFPRLASSSSLRVGLTRGVLWLIGIVGMFDGIKLLISGK